jgi:hypothetical protein
VIIRLTDQRTRQRRFSAPIPLGSRNVSPSVSNDFRDDLRGMEVLVGSFLANTSLRSLETVYETVLEMTTSSPSKPTISKIMIFIVFLKPCMIFL